MTEDRMITINNITYFDTETEYGLVPIDQLEHLNEQSEDNEQLS